MKKVVIDITNPLPILAQTLIGGIVMDVFFRYVDLGFLATVHIYTISLSVYFCVYWLLGQFDI